MARNSLSNLRAQIAKLELRAEAIKRTVVTRLQKEIRAHGLTAEDLFGGGSIAGSSRKAPPTGSAVRRTAKPASKSAAKYGDSDGNTWGGMGKRPQWLRSRIEAGAKLEDFLLTGGADDIGIVPEGHYPAEKTAVRRTIKKAVRKNAPKSAVKTARKAGDQPKPVAKKAAKVTRKPRTAAKKAGEQSAQA